MKALVTILLIVVVSTVVISYYIVFPMIVLFATLLFKCVLFFAKIALLVIPVLWVVWIINRNLERISRAVTHFWVRHHKIIVIAVSTPFWIFVARTTFLGLYHIIAFSTGYLDDDDNAMSERHLWVVHSCALPASIYGWQWIRYCNLTAQERRSRLVYHTLPGKMKKLRGKVNAEERQNERVVESISKTITTQLTITARQAQIQSLVLDKCKTVDCTQLHGSLVQLVNHLGDLKNVFDSSLKAVQKLDEEASTFSHSLVGGAQQDISKETVTLDARTSEQEMEIRQQQAKLRLRVQEESEAKERVANLPTVKAEALKSIRISSVFLTIACWPVGVTSFVFRRQRHEAKYKELYTAYSAQHETARLQQQLLKYSVSSLEESMNSLQLEKKEVEKLLKACGDLREQCQDIFNKLQASRMFYSDMVMQCSLAANDIKNSKMVATRPRTVARLQDAFKQLSERLVLTERDRVLILGEFEARGSRRVSASRA